MKSDSDIVLRLQLLSKASVTRDRAITKIARLVTNLGDVRLVATTKDKSLGLSTVYR